MLTRLQRIRGFSASAAALATSQYAAAGLGAITAIVAARLLGPAAYGVASIVMAYPILGRTLAAFKTKPVILRYSVGFLEKRDWIRLGAVLKLGAMIDLSATLIGSLVAVVAVLVIGDVPGAPGTIHLVILYSLSLPLFALGSPATQILLTVRRYKVIALVGVGQKVTILVCVLLALAFRRSADALVIGTAIGQGLAGIGSVVVASSLLTRLGARWWTGSWKESLHSLQHLSGELRHLLGWNFFERCVSGVTLQAPIVLLGALASPVDAGFFRIGSSITVVANNAQNALSQVAMPALSSAFSQGAAAKFGRLIVGWSKHEALVAAAGVIGMTALLPLLVPLAAGDQYRAMIPGLEVMMIGSVFNVLFFYVMPEMYVTGRVRRWVIAESLYTAVVLVVGVALAAQVGFLAFAIPVGVGWACLNLLLGISVIRSARRLVHTRDASLLDRSPLRRPMDLSDVAPR